MNSHFPTLKKLNFKIDRVTPSLRITTDRVQTNGIKAKAALVIVHAFRISIVAKKTVIPELFVLKQDLKK